MSWTGGVDKGFMEKNGLNTSLAVGPRVVTVTKAA